MPNQFGRALGHQNNVLHEIHVGYFFALTHVKTRMLTWFGASKNVLHEFHVIRWRDMYVVHATKKIVPKRRGVGLKSC